MKAYKTMIKNALNAGYGLKICCEGEVLHYGVITKFAEAVAEIESVEFAEVVILKAGVTGPVVGNAWVIPYGVDDDETIADYTTGDEMVALIPKA